MTIRSTSSKMSILFVVMFLSPADISFAASLNCRPNFNQAIAEIDNPENRWIVCDIHCEFFISGQYGGWQNVNLQSLKVYAKERRTFIVGRTSDHSGNSYTLARNAQLQCRPAQ